MVGIEAASRRDIRDDLRTTLILSRIVVIALALLVGLVGGLEAPVTVVILAVLCGGLVITDIVITSLDETSTNAAS